MLDLSERNDKLAGSIAQRFPKFSRNPDWVLVRNDSGWTIQFNDYSIARFNLVLMPNCGPVVILCDVWVAPAYRNMGIGSSLHQLCLDGAVESGCPVMLCTTRMNNHSQVHILGKFNWQLVARFTNNTSGNELGLYSKGLQQEKKDDNGAS